VYIAATISWLSSLTKRMIRFRMLVRSDLVDVHKTRLNCFLIGIFEYTTSLPYPFRVENVTGLTFPAPLAGSSGPIENLGCNTTVNSNCLQKFRLTINPNGACRLSGDYNITVVLGCRGDANCPPGSGVIASQITSEDICSVVRIDIDLTGSMRVYSDDTFTSPADAFLPGQSAVFLTNVGSTKAIIASSSISDVFYTMPDGTSNSLYSGTKLRGNAKFHANEDF
jgi:hypothetical protein